MSKNKLRLVAAQGILMIVLTVIALAVPFTRNASFWIGYVFTMLAILLQYPMMLAAFEKGAGVKSKFYGFPIARLSVIYLLAQLVAGICFMAFSTLAPAWIGVVVFVLLLAATLLGYIAADTVREEINNLDESLHKSTSSMRSMQSKLGGLLCQCDDSGLKKEAEKLFEAFRYSDPVSSEALKEIESELDNYINELQMMVVDGDQTAAMNLCKKINVTLVERNRLCKLNK